MLKDYQEVGCPDGGITKPWSRVINELNSRIMIEADRSSVAEIHVRPRSGNVGRVLVHLVLSAK